MYVQFCTCYAIKTLPFEALFSVWIFFFDWSDAERALFKDVYPFSSFSSTHYWVTPHIKHTESSSLHSEWLWWGRCLCTPPCNFVSASFCDQREGITEVAVDVPSAREHILRSKSRKRGMGAGVVNSSRHCTWDEKSSAAKKKKKISLLCPHIISFFMHFN